MLGQGLFATLFKTICMYIYAVPTCMLYSLSETSRDSLWLLSGLEMPSVSSKPAYSVCSCPETAAAYSAYIFALCVMGQLNSSDTDRCGRGRRLWVSSGTFCRRWTCCHSIQHLRHGPCNVSRTIVTIYSTHVRYSVRG